MNEIDLGMVVVQCVMQKKKIEDVITFREYIPVQEKLAAIDSYIRSLTCYSKGVDYIDTFEQYFKFTMMAVKLYTNISIKAEYSEYDLLVKNGVLEQILKYVHDDYVDLKSIADMKLGDFIRRLQH